MDTQLVRNSKYRTEIQGLRAVAVLLVVLYHSDVIFKSGFVGVDVFFVISGYVIARSLTTDIFELSNFSVASFYARRIRRLLPALAVMLATVLFLSTWFSTISSRVQTVRTGLFATFSLSNIFLFRFRPDGYFEVTEKTNALLHTWSLSIEEQFYLAFPLFVLLIIYLCKIARINQQKLFVIVFLCIAIISFCASAYISINGIHGLTGILSRAFGSSTLDSRFAFYMPFTRAWEFLAGVLVAQIRRKSESKGISETGGLLGLILIAVSALSFQKVSSFPGLVVLVPVIGTSLVLFFSSGSTGLGRTLSRKWLVWIGDRSYGWYLWHWPIIQFVKPFWPNNTIASALAGVSAIIPAAVSYRFLENRFRYQLHWSKPGRMAVLVSASLLLPVVAGISSRPLMPELGQHLDATTGCEYGDLTNIEPGGKCVFPSGINGGSAVLIGDSHAGHLTEAFIPASHELGLDAVVAVKGNSPFLFKPWDSGFTTESYPFISLQRIKELKPSVVVIAQSGYNQDAPQGTNWSDEFLPVLQVLEEANIPVVVVAASVNVGAYPQTCSIIQVNFRMCPAEQNLSRTELDNGRSYRTSEEKIAVSKVSNAIIFDTLQVLCPNEKCSTFRNGKWWWRDEAHISITASNAMIPMMTESMRQAINLKN